MSIFTVVSTATHVSVSLLQASVMLPEVQLDQLSISPARTIVLPLRSLRSVTGVCCPAAGLQSLEVHVQGPAVDLPEDILIPLQQLTNLELTGRHQTDVTRSATQQLNSVMSQRLGVLVRNVALPAWWAQFRPTCWVHVAVGRPCHAAACVKEVDRMCAHAAVASAIHHSILSAPFMPLQCLTHIQCTLFLHIQHLRIGHSALACRGCVPVGLLYTVIIMPEHMRLLILQQSTHSCSCSLCL